jgi:hypothetical protein
LEVAPRDGAPRWIEESAEGLTIYIARSKTDQTGEGDAIGIPYGSSPKTCPVRAYKNWLQRSGIIAGPAFRPITRHGRMGNNAMTDRTVAQRAIIQARWQTDWRHRKQLLSLPSSAATLCEQVLRPAPP